MAVDADLAAYDIAYGPDGSLYIADVDHWALRRVRPDGIIERIAGTGVDDGFSPDGTPPLEASIQPQHIAVDASGDVLFVDRGRLRKIAGGVVVTVAGTGSEDVSGDGGPAVEAAIGYLPRIEVEDDGSILLAESRHFLVRRIALDGTIDTIAGKIPADTSAFEPTGDGGPATDAVIGEIYGLAVAPDGSIYVAGRLPSFVTQIRRILPDGTIESLTQGTYSISDLAFYSDGTLVGIRDGGVRVYAEEAEWGPVLGSAFRIATSSTGQLAALRGGAQVIAIADEEEVVVAGTGNLALHGEGGPASLAHVGRANGISVGSDGTIYYHDETLDRIRRITPAGAMERLASESDLTFFRLAGIAAGPDGVLYALMERGSHPFEPPLLAITTESVSAVPSSFDTTDADRYDYYDIAVDGDGDPVVTFQDNSNRNAIEFMDEAPSRILLDGFNTNQVAVGLDGRAVIATRDGNWLRVATDGQAEPIAGLTGIRAGVGADSIAVGPDGSLYWASGRNIYRMLPNQAIDRIASSTVSGHSGDGGPASEAQLSDVRDMAFGPDGHLYVSDWDRIRRITSPNECPSDGIRPEISYLGVVNSASYSDLAPGSIFALFGIGIGPEDLAGAVLGPDGKLPTELGGVRVLIDGVPAPLLFASSGQVNGIIPFGTRVGIRLEDSFPVYVDEERAAAVVERDGKSSDEEPLWINEFAPGIFTLDASGQGPGAFLDANSVLIGPDNPASPGSVVVMWATGAGVMDPGQEDGSITNGPTLPKPLLPVAVEVGGLPAVVEYAGAAPGLAAGVIQVNVRIPEGLAQTGDVSVRMFIGEPPNTSASASVTVYVGMNE